MQIRVTYTVELDDDLDAAVKRARNAGHQPGDAHDQDRELIKLLLLHSGLDALKGLEFSYVRQKDR